MNNRFPFITLVLLAMVWLGTACSAPVAANVQAGEPATSTTYTIEMTAEGLRIPEEVPSGIVPVSYENRSEIRHMSILARFNDGVTEDAFNAALAGEDPMAAFALVYWLGGVALPPDGEQQMVHELTPGPHVLIDFGDQGPQVFPIQVTDAQSSDVAPTATIHAELKDFAVIMPDSIPAGRQQWEITNNGGQWHEIQLVKLNEGATVQDAIDYTSQGPTPVGTPPFELMAFIAPLNPGERVWTSLDLPPGEYTIICALPDLVGGHDHTHAHLGMVRQLTVTD